MTLLKTFACIAILTLCVVFEASSAYALTISPVKLEINGDPGQTLTGELELFNEQTETKSLFSSYENFEPSGDTGSPRFTDGATGLATWISLASNVVIQPNQTVKVPYTITIPADAEPGGYFSAVFWSEDNPAAREGGEVSIGGKLGVLILMRVNGDIKEAAGISNFSIDGSRWVTKLPISFVYRFKNDGADRVVPLGNIEIKNIFGGVTAVLPANENEGSVLPNSIRKFQTLWGVPKKDGESSGFFTVAQAQLSDFHLGVYSANLTLTYGATNQIAMDSFYFFFIPWQLLSIVVVILIVLSVLLKFYNRWIIAKSKTNV